MQKHIMNMRYTYKGIPLSQWEARLNVSAFAVNTLAEAINYQVLEVYSNKRITIMKIEKYLEIGLLAKIWSISENSQDGAPPLRAPKIFITIVH